MKYRSLLFASVMVLSSCIVSSANAASQSTFSISPPPIATPVFDKKETDMKIGLTYLNMKSIDTTVSDIKLNGYGINMVGRSAFGTVVAIDYAVGIMYMSGDISSALTGTSKTKTDLSGASIPISFNLEVQPYKNDAVNVIFFAGPSFNITAMSLKYTYAIGTSTGSDTMTINSYLYGLQGGVQVGFGLGDVNVDMFGMATNLRGSQDVSTSFGDDSSTIPAYTTTSYGLDLLYVPWGVSLSSIVQQADQGDKNGFKTTIYTLSWSHKF